MESNQEQRRQRRRLAAGVSIGDDEIIGIIDPVSQGGGDADNEAEIRRQMEMLLQRMESVISEIMEDVENGEEGGGGGEEQEIEMFVDEIFDYESFEEDEVAVAAADEEELQQLDYDESEPEQEQELHLLSPLQGDEEPNEFIRFCVRLSMNTLFYPYELARILIQLGHEPMPSTVCKFWIFRPLVFLPSVHKYVQFIKRYDGFAGLYRGLAPRLIGSAISFLGSECLLKLLGMRPYQRDPKDGPHPFGEFAWDLLRESIRLTTASLLSYPFHVIMVRQAAQFVGQETVFRSLQSSFKQIFQNDGILGFYSGFVPKLIGELSVLVITSTVSYLWKRYLPPTTGVARQYGAAIAQILAGLAMHPLEVVSSCMACSGAPLAAGAPPFMPLYGNWLDCLSDLYARGEHNRGMLLFWRTVPRFQIQTGLIDGPPYVRTV